MPLNSEKIDEIQAIAKLGKLCFSMSQAASRYSIAIILLTGFAIYWLIRVLAIVGFSKAFLGGLITVVPFATIFIASLCHRVIGTKLKSKCKDDHVWNSFRDRKFDGFFADLAQASLANRIALVLFFLAEIVVLVGVGAFVGGLSIAYLHFNLISGK